MNVPMIRPVSPFAAATLVPVPLLILGGLLGGVFILTALLCLTLLSAVLDRLITTAGKDAAPGVEFPAAGRLSEILVGAHAVLLVVAVAAVSGATGLGFWEGLAALVAFGLWFGQVSNSNAHELIHSPSRLRRRMGKWVLISLLFGHHVTAHLRIHHRHVGTPDDPNTARLGEGFYAFAARAWPGSFVAGWEIEKSLAEVKGAALPWWRHPYAEYVGGALGFLILASLAFGASGLIAYLLIALYAQAQLLLSDYVQHYGLRRRKLDEEGWEPVAPWHSWNAPQWYSGGLMLNAPRHSEHHTNPTRPFPELSLPDWREGPRLPSGLPVMGAAALVPPLWRALMDKRALSWQKRIDEGRIPRTPPPGLLPAREGLLDWLARLRPARARAPAAQAPVAAPARPMPSYRDDVADEAVASRLVAALAAARPAAPPGAAAVPVPAADTALAPAAAPGPAAAEMPEPEEWEEGPGADPAGGAAAAEAVPAAGEAAPAGRPVAAEVAPPAQPLSPVVQTDGTLPGLSPQFLRQLAGGHVPVAEHLVARAERERAEAVRAATSELWSGELEPEAPEDTEGEEGEAGGDRQVPSSSLFQPQPGEAELAPGERLDGGQRDALRPGTEPVDLEGAVARTVASERRDQRRKRASFPAVDDFEDRPPPGFRERLELLGSCALLAAQGVAAVLQGRPAVEHRGD